jgi:hypothetical protein
MQGEVCRCSQHGVGENVAVQSHPVVLLLDILQAFWNKDKGKSGQGWYNTLQHIGFQMEKK